MKILCEIRDKMEFDYEVNKTFYTLQYLKKTGVINDYEEIKIRAEFDKKMRIIEIPDTYYRLIYKMTRFLMETELSKEVTFSEALGYVLSDNFNRNALKQRFFESKVFENQRRINDRFNEKIKNGIDCLISELEEEETR